MKFDKTKLLALSMAAVMAVSAVGCGGNSGNTPAPAADSTEQTEQTEQQPAAEESNLAADVYAEYDASNWTEESDALYAETLGSYMEYYEKAKEVDNLSERFALMAVSEAKMLEEAIMIPLSTRGGNYAISRVVPNTANTTLWGNDNDRFHDLLICTEPMIPADRDAVKEMWVQLKGTGTFLDSARAYVTEHGYELKDEYNYIYNSDPKTWDALGTSRAADSEAIVNTYDGLMEYDVENVQQPALATEYSVSEDGLTYTFKIREGVTWVDSQGREIAPVTADDFVAGMQHMMDAQGGLEYLVGADGCNIKNADAYISREITDFAEVGVKAVDEYTLEYTLEAPCSFFMTMLGYNVFAPMNRTYYESQGGKFGEEFSSEDETYLYGTDKDHIAYCGPYLVTNATAENTIVFEANPSYWNKDNINIHKITWKFNDGKDATKAYNDTMSGVVDGSGLNDEAITASKKDGNFDKYAYVSATDATSFMGFININRKAFANFNDATVARSEKTADEADRTTAAMQNVHFRRALVTSLDRGSYNAQSVGEDLKLNSLRNSYTPGTFVSLEEDTTIQINGEDVTFPAGTFYGAIMQAQIDADGMPVKVWDPTMDGGIGSTDGFDGWYNVEYAKSELETAIAELAEEGVTVDADNPIYIDVPYFAGSTTYTNRANVFKQSFESSLDKKVIVNLVKCDSADDWYYAGYYPDYGYEMNADIMDVSGWGPDYGDPQTYLDTMLPNYAGYMVKSIGMY